jgi:hypothetical protein
MKNSCARLGPLLLGVLFYSAPVQGQPHQASNDPRAIGQIVNEVLDSLLPSTGPTPHEVWRRGVLFDYQRTLAAFHASPSVPTSALGLRHSMQQGSASMLDDCDQLGGKPCRQLGWRVYAYVEPIRITETQARVRAVMLYAQRRMPFAEGSTPGGTAFLTGGTTEVYLTRVKGGPWKYLKTGVSQVM